MNRKKIIALNTFKLIYLALLTSFASTLIAYSLKHLAEKVEMIFFYKLQDFPWMFLLMPAIGLTIIFFLRKYFFRNRKNKGIAEIYKSLEFRKDHLPFFKIPSHYLNGFFTVIFGGSTGVEVSTVVSTATAGNVVYKKSKIAQRYKTELICSGVVAGIAILVGSPIAGWLFAMEVIARRVNKSLIISCSASALLVGVFIYFFDNEPFYAFATSPWNWSAIPYLVVLALLSGSFSVYFTWLVLFCKEYFAKINNNALRIGLGAVLLGVMILVFPFLYGDSYHGVKEIIQHLFELKEVSILWLIILVLIKPIASAITLGAGGDGGVFAPSIICGALLGILMALIANTYFQTDLNPLNFALFGTAATLSASIYGPLTAVFLACNMTSEGYHLFLPLLIISFASKFIAQKLLPYNVYTYSLVK